MVLSTQQVRDEYGADCTERDAAGAQQAWDALSGWMQHFAYKLRQADTGARACRNITGGTLKSLHAVFLKVRILLWNLAIRITGGAACDFNWQTNPYGARLVTDMPRQMVDAICGIRTRNGKQVFRWGGYYAGNKDAMHYELVCSKADLATGLDPATLAPGAASDEDDMNELQDRRLANVDIVTANIEARVIELTALVRTQQDPAKFAAEVAKHLDGISEAQVAAAFRKVLTEGVGG